MGLSIPAVMSLAVTLSFMLMDEAAGTETLGLPDALQLGIGAGVANYALIWLLHIPPIIATLSASSCSSR